MTIAGLNTKKLALLALMLTSAALAHMLRPDQALASERPQIHLESMVPSTFADWKKLDNISAQIVDPQQAQKIAEIYTETLSRTYVNSKGYRIMLSIAYGKNQSDALQLHKPEVCYPAQGFKLISKHASTVLLATGPIATTRLETNLGQRYEPVTYWTIVGDHITKTSIDKKLVEMRYAFQGKIPDGMLVRISSIDRDTEAAYEIQSQFAIQMVEAIDTGTRTRFAGALPQN
nr:exosortase-associated protein EpsI, B-type [uncultured Rhodoferax sp.]